MGGKKKGHFRPVEVAAITDIAVERLSIKTSDRSPPVPFLAHLLSPTTCLPLAGAWYLDGVS